MVTIVRFLNIFLAALLAGTSFGIWVGFNPRGFSPKTYLEHQQHLVSSLNTLMVSMVILATLLTMVSAYLHRKNKELLSALVLAALFFASCIVISRVGNLPIQSEMLAWNIENMPSNWEEMRDKWWTFHIYRTIAELLALALVSWASIAGSSKTL